MIPQITEINFPAYATLNNATVTLAEMGDRTITTQIKIDGDIVPDFTGWALEFKGERFVLPTKEPQAAKDNTSRRSTVDLTFTSWAVNELKRYFFVEMASITAGTAIADKYKASLGLNLENFVIAFNNVLDYYFAGQIRMDLFGAGTGMYSQEPSFVEIDNTYIWEVLQKVYEIYDVRWTFAYDDTNHRYLIKVGYPAPEIDDHDFEYGYQGGLLRFERQVQDYDITNVLLGRGGEKNLPYRYFKKVDPNNPEWQADPDAIPELKNIYFENLRDINFRRYVQGWKTNPLRMLEEGDVIEDYDTERAETDWAYAKGHTDAKFNPVEYVKDDDSIALYGEHWGALENNENIFPSIQGIEVPPYGRIDEVVDVEPITTDDIEAMAADAAVITNVQGATRTEWIPYNNRLTIELTGADFTVPENKTGNLTMVGTWVKSVQYGKKNGHQDNIEPDSAIANLVNIDTTNSYIVAVRKDNSQEYPISGLAAGSYYYKMHIEVRSEFEREQYDEVSVTVGVDSLKLTVSEGTANAWKPTFDIWVKNIWDTTQGANETDAAYAARVWEPILGDRTGAEAAVVFSTGFLSISADYNFVIASIPVVDRTKTIDGVASEWRITLIKSDAEYDATGKYIPNSETGGNATAGDFFYFTGIDMPWIYVKWAEERLNAYKETELAKVKQINPTWVVQIDKVRANTKEQGELEYLADRFASGAKLRVRDKRFTNNNILTLYVQTITYTWQQPSSGNPYLVPDIEVVLSDKIVSVESPIDRLEGSVDLIQTSYAKISDIEGAIRRVASPIFLKKTGESEMSLSPTRFSSIVSSESFRQGDIGGQGWGAYVDGEGHTVLEADTVVVRKDMRVNTLTVNQIAYLGGKQIISAAAMECNRVEEVDGGYKCYFDQKQGSVANLFKVDDVVLGQVWNADESELRYYKRKVIAIDSDSITLSSSIADGTGVPHPKDIMVQYGSYSDTSRQYVILRDVIGGGYERMLSGLTSVYTDGTEYYFAGRQDGSTPRWFVGDALGQYASYQNGVLNIAGRLAVTTQIDTGNGTYTALSNYLSSLQDQIDSTVQTWYAAGVPTLNNYPANTWATVEDKNNHIGDLYYDSDTGKAYRFMLDGNTYKWVQLADEDIAAALALAQQNQTAIAGLQYLKAATNQGTLVQGGLVLTSMIQLGQTEQGVYKVYSGINGIMDPTALGNGIAAWYGGQMADKGADNTLTNYAKSLFRFDGSGYLASGNIKWDLNGNGQIPGITWENGRITLSSDIYLQGGDRLTALIDAVNRMYSQFAYDSQDHITVAPTHALYIPTTSPEYPIAGKVALYYDYNGFYSETPGGGVANIFDLTIRRGSVSAGTYNLGEQAADINLASLFAGYATETWVSANFNKYVLPIASASTLGGIKVGNGLSIDSSTGVLTATYSYTLPTASSSVKGGVKVGNTLTISNEVLNVVAGSVAQSNTGFVTGGDVYSAIAAAVTSALHYRGISSVELTDGGTETAVIGGESLVPQAGDVVIYNGLEFLWEKNSSNIYVWNKLGDDTSYAKKTYQIIAGTGLTGGGYLSGDITLSLSSATITSLGKADTAYQKPSGGIPATDLADAYLPLSAGSSKPLTDDLYFTKTIYGADVQVGRIGSVIDGGIVTYFTNPSSGSGSGTGPGFAIINTPYERLLFWLGSTDDSLEIYHEGNLTKGVLTTLLESNNGYYVKKAGDTMTGDLTFDASSAAKEIKFGYASSGSGSAVKMGNDGKLYFGADQLTNNKDTYIYGGNISISWYREAVSGGNVVISGSGNYFAPNNNSINLGHSSYRWSTVYSQYVNASNSISSAGTLSVTGVSTLSGGAKVSTMLAIPQSAPSTSASWYSANDAYLYAGTSGNYSESAGGGVADVYPLTITKNGSAWLSYNPGVQAESINLAIPTKVSDLTNDTGFITASSIPSTYAWSAITNTPTTLSGYGITDAKIETPSGTTNKKITLGSNNFTIYSWALASSKPSYAFSDLTAHPTTISGYGITDAKIANGVITLGSNSITPLTSFTETDPVFSASAAAGITSTNISNWNTAYGWGNHASQGYLKSSDHKALTIKVGSTTIGSDYNSLAAKTYTITAQNITDAIGSTTYAPYNTNGYVPTTRKVNNKALSSDITLSLDDVADGSTRKLANYLPLAGGTMTGAIVPNSANTIDFGTSTYYWKGIYAETLYGTLNDFTYLNNHPLNIDNAAIRGVNFHYANAGTKPTGSQDGSALTLAYSSAWVTQMYGDWRTNKFYTRVKTNGTWGDWAELATTKGTVEGLNTSTESDATFTYRAVPSVAVGDVARVTRVKGKSIVWNQQINPTWLQVTTTSTGVTITNNGDGSWTLTGTNDGTNLNFVAIITSTKFVVGHKYILRGMQRQTSAAKFKLIDTDNGYATDDGSGVVYTATNGTTFQSAFRLRCDSGASAGTGLRLAPQLIDLTLMFGKGSEPTSVAEFEALYSEVFYSYNTGELVSNSASAIETVGFNQCVEPPINRAATTFPAFDATKYSRVFGGIQYYLCHSALPVANWRHIYKIYDIEGNEITANAFTSIDLTTYYSGGEWLEGTNNTNTSRTITFAQDCYVYFGFEYGGVTATTTMPADFNINFSDASRNGQYEPYRKDNLPLNITKLKVDTTNLWDEIYEAGSYDNNGAKIAVNNTWRNTNPIPVSGGKVYYTNYILYRYYYDAAMNFISYDNSGSYKFTTPVNAVYMNIRQGSETAPKFSVWINTPTKRPPLKLNQLLWIPTFTSFTQRSVTITNNNDGTFTLNGTADSSGSITTFRWSGFTVYGGRKYLTVLKRLSGTISVRPYLRLIPTNKGAGTGTYFGATVGTVSSANEGDPYMAFYVVSGVVLTNYKVMPMLIDLTAMYGAGFEPSTPDEFFELVGDSYIPYNTDREVPYFIYPKGMKGTGTASDEVIGEKAIRRYGCIDLGDCNWSYSSSQFIATELIGLIKEPTATSEVPNIICEKYVPSSYGAFADKNIMVIFASSSLHGRVYIKDSAYTDSTSYFNSIPGTKLYYELATPIEYDLETAVPELIECDVLGTQRRLPEDTASSVQAPFHCDFQYGANPGEIVSDSAYRYLPLAGGTVYGTLEASGELIIPDHAPYQPEPNKHYLYVNDNGNYYQS